jgi:hypothetical protein
MVQKSKTGTKGADKQHQGTEEFRSGSSNLQKGSGTHEGSRSSMKKQGGESLEEPKPGQQKVKQEQGSSRKKSR